MAVQSNKLYTPVQRARRRINKAAPSRQVQLKQNKAAQNLVPPMSEMIKQQAKFMKRAGRMKY